MVDGSAMVSLREQPIVPRPAIAALMDERRPDSGAGA
jgi:hypothetical protein